MNELDYKTLEKFKLTNLCCRDIESRVVIYNKSYGAYVSMRDIKDYDEGLCHEMIRDAKALGVDDCGDVRVLLRCEISEDGNVTATLNGGFSSAKERLIFAIFGGEEPPFTDFPRSYPVKLSDDLKYMVICDFENRRYDYNRRLRFKAFCDAYSKETPVSGVRIDLFTLAIEAAHIFEREIYTEEEVDKILKERNTGLTVKDIKDEIERKGLNKKHSEDEGDKDLDR